MANATSGVSRSTLEIAVTGDAMGCPGSLADGVEVSTVCSGFEMSVRVRI